MRARAFIDSLIGRRIGPQDVAGVLEGRGTADHDFSVRERQRALLGEQVGCLPGCSPSRRLRRRTECAPSREDGVACFLIIIAQLAKHLRERVRS